MKTNKNRLVFRIVLIASFLAINAIILWGISAVWSYMNTGAKKSSILQIESQMEARYTPSISWGSLENPGRPMEEHTLKEIQRDYLNAWHVRNIAYQNNDRYGVSDYYTDSAKVRVFEQIDFNIKNNTWFKSTTLEHHPELDFYSEDGTLVVFTDHRVEGYTETYKSEALIYKQKETHTYQVMMLLEDGFWRIRHLQEKEVVQKDSSKEGRIESSLNLITTIKGINYYPQKSAWDTFGKRFNTDVISADFKLLKKMGVNTIRIFVPYEDFGKSQVPAKRLNRLQKTLDIAHANEVKVMITLFDFYGDYDLMNWTITHRHAEQIVTALKNHPALLAWDIKNEPDLDFASRGKTRVLDWLKEMVIQLKKWDANHPVTIGWSNPKAAMHLINSVDFVSYHYYGEADEFLRAHRQLIAKTNKKPVLLQEYGLSSYSGVWNLFAGSESAQADYYSKMQLLLKEEKAAFMFWTLYDFEQVPTQVAGSLPWRTRKQKHFGCIDVNGLKKPAFDILSK